MVAFVMLIAMAAFAGSASAADTDEKLIHVSGTGKVTTDPDIVEVSIAVQTENTDGVVAQQENADKMSKCINALKALGFTDEELKTTGYSMYSYKTDSSSPFGKDKIVYRVTNTLLVKTGKTDMAGDIIDTAIANGANNVNYISFSLSDEKSQSLRAEALVKAVAQARSDADAVSAALGVSIMGVQSVNVGTSYTPYTYAETSFKNVAMDSATGASYSTPVQTDTVDVTASVSIDYIIR
ncbi:MAG: SIMPL domain-containing protein [Methanomicrobium sp.]|nr:SIMPL domain-containing protein [Methanomicrobium sp.]